MTQSGLSLIAVLLLPILLVSCGNETNNDAAEQTHVFDTLTTANFADFIGADGVKIVEFGGKNCAPCSRMRERLIALQQERPALKLGLVFWEDQPELFKDQGVTYIPAQVVYDAQGKETARHVGEWELKAMRHALKKIEELRETDSPLASHFPPS